MSDGHKCSYSHCQKSRKNAKDVRFHVFPKDFTNSKIWVLNSGNSKLYSLRHEQLRKRFLCSDHSIDSMYMNADKNRLIQKAVPIKYTAQPIGQIKDSTSLEVLIPKKKYNRKTMNILDHKNAASSMFSSSLTVTTDMQNYISDLPELPSSSTFNSTLTVTPDTQNYNSDLPELPSSINYNCTSMNVSLSLQLKNEHLENRCKKLEKLLNKKTVTISNLKNRYFKLLNNKRVKFNSKLFIESMMFQSINSKSLVSMQMNLTTHKPLNSDEKKLSLALYLKSPSIYSYLRKNKIRLPGENTVRTWINPGFQRGLEIPVFATFY